MKQRISIRSARGIAAQAKEYYPVIKKAAREALNFERADAPCAIDVYICGDSEMQKINMLHRGVDKTTDVLSFPMFEFKDGFDPVIAILSQDGELFLGDIIISLDRAVSQASEYAHSVSRELGFLTVHAVLHLLGYDHERGEKQEEDMFSKQEEILKKSGLER